MKTYEKEAIDCLKGKALRQTAARLQVLSVLFAKGVALSHADIEEGVHGELDRVTLYRTLNTFEERGVTHRVMDDGGTAKYALCDHSCNDAHHNDHHLHFHCKTCGDIFCLDDHIGPQPNLPLGFLVEHIEVNVKGVCKKCSKTN